MLDQKIFGEKLKNHRKMLGYTQEAVAEQLGVSAQAVSKWESGDCLPDCINLKSISDLYKVSTDVLLETENNGDLKSVSDKIEQIGTEFIWANAKKYQNAHLELGNDLLSMWKGLYFAECGDKDISQQSKEQGNLRICGPFGTKIWDDEGITCVIKSELIRNMQESSDRSYDIVSELCTKEAQQIIRMLYTHKPVPKEKIIEKTGIEIHRLNELLLKLTEGNIIEYVCDGRVSFPEYGYKLSGHCGIVAYMIASCFYIIDKKQCTISEYLCNPD